MDGSRSHVGARPKLFADGRFVAVLPADYRVTYYAGGWFDHRESLLLEPADQSTRKNCVYQAHLTRYGNILCRLQTMGGPGWASPLFGPAPKIDRPKRTRGMNALVGRTRDR